MENNLKKKKEESFEEYCHRISELKDSINATWDKVASIINGETGCDFTGDKYRKQERRFQNTLTPVENEVEAEETEEAEELNYVPFDKETISINYTKNETTSAREIPLTDKQLRDPNELLKAHGFNPDEFELKQATNAKTTRTTINGDVHVYASRITVKPKKSMVSDIEKVAEYFKTFKAPKIDLAKKYSNSEETLLIPLYDFHWGRIEEKDSNYEGFDVETEAKRIIDHVSKYAAKFKNRHFKKVYLVIGQDFFNSSFTNFTSSQQHLQSNALEFKTMFKSGCEILINIINMFAELGNDVEVVGSVGNHSWSEEVAAFYLLEAYYRNTDNVTVDPEGSVRKYLEIGNSCVGLAHADKEGKRLYGLMQVEAKDIWARTKTHVFITGHLHHAEMSSENGVEVYRCPSICYHDKWTVDNGYTANEPKTMCFIFDEQEGLTETHFMYL